MAAAAITAIKGVHFLYLYRIIMQIKPFGRRGRASRRVWLTKKEGILMNKYLKAASALLLASALSLSLAACGGDAVVIKSIDDLNGKKIGVQLGTTGDIYAEDIEGATVERFQNGAAAVLALKQKNVDAVIIDDQPARVYASKNNDIVVLDEPFTIEDYAICVSKSNSDLTAKMNAAIGELKSDGTLQKILDYYIGQVEGAVPYASPAGVSYPNGTLVMATNAEFPPYEYFEGDEVVGVDPDFARAICDKIGYELKIEHMEFSSIITAVQTGKADFGAAGMTVTEDRLQNIDFTESYVTASQVVIIRK
jgi:polar amino acid transport system substrate-binding protein